MATAILLLLLLATGVMAVLWALRAHTDPQSRRWRILIGGLALTMALGLALWLAIMLLVVGPELRNG